MTQENQQTKAKILDSKFFRALLIIVAALFAFGGPYLTYLLIHILDMGYAISMVSGFAVFFVGLVLIWYLIKNKMIA